MTSDNNTALVCQNNASQDCSTERTKRKLLFPDNLIIINSACNKDLESSFNFVSRDVILKLLNLLFFFRKSG